MDRDLLRRWLETQAEISFARSSGPGGQNVNKVNTKAVIRVPLGEIPGLTGGERAYLAARLAPRLSAGDVLVVQAQDERSQSMNREIAMRRVLALIERGLSRPKPRRPTRPTRASRERRLQAKRVASVRKRMRSGPEPD